MGTATTVPTAVTLAVLGELDLTSGRPDRIHAVAAWTDRGGRQLRRLAAPITCEDPRARRLLAASFTRPCQLRLRLPEVPLCTSGGSTWRTWMLPSIPTDLRQVPSHELVDQLAVRLDGSV